MEYLILYPIGTVSQNWNKCISDFGKTRYVQQTLDLQLIITNYSICFCQTFCFPYLQIPIVHSIGILWTIGIGSSQWLYRSYCKCVTFLFWFLTYFCGFSGFPIFNHDSISNNKGRLARKLWTIVVILQIWETANFDERLKRIFAYIWGPKNGWELGFFVLYSIEGPVGRVSNCFFT